nr:unnamed protein product [Meloidogyne enterolobii]
MDRKFIWRFVRSGNTMSEEDNITLYEGTINSMECEGQAINQATTDMQIGVAITDKNLTYKEDDRVEVFEEVQVPQQINWNPPGF